MNPKAKKALIIAGVALDILITVLLSIFSVIIIVKMPQTSLSIDKDTFLGWFQVKPYRILLLDVLPLALLLVTNISLTIWYIKRTGKKEEEKKQVTLNDLSDEEKTALKQKILQEMMQESNESK